MQLLHRNQAIAISVDNAVVQRESLNLWLQKADMDDEKNRVCHRIHLGYIASIDKVDQTIQVRFTSLTLWIFTNKNK